MSPVQADVDGADSYQRDETREAPETCTAHEQPQCSSQGWATLPSWQRGLALLQEPKSAVVGGQGQSGFVC